MGPRPANLNLGNDHADAFQPPKMPFAPRDLPSPRAGEIPPALSPLDAFAMHSRMLARKFDEEAQNGRRMSRLPPTMVAKEMSNRPGYFRTLSSETKMSDLTELNEDASPISAHGKTFEPESPSKERPVSHYPTIGTAARPDDDVPPIPTPFFDAVEQRPSTSGKDAPSPDYFNIGGVPRASSPEPVSPRLFNVQAPSPNDFPSLTSSIDTVSSHPRTMTNDSQRSQRSLASERGLAPPHSPRFPKSPRSFQSIRSVPPDSGDEDGASVSGSQAVSSSRKFSGSSNMSRPQSPFSPWMQPVHRSPSMTSEYSMGGSALPRPPANFSRPMSSAGSRPSFDTRPSFDGRPSSDKKRPDLPQRQASGASNSTDQSFRPAISRQASDDDAEPTLPDVGHPADVIPERSTTSSGQSSSSYIYAKYAIPRQQPVDRDSQAFRDSWIQKQFEWDRKHDHKFQHHERTQSENPALDAQARASPALSEMARPGRSLIPKTSEVRSHSADPRSLDRASAMHRSSPSVKTDSTDRTIKATPLHQKSASADLSAEEHLDIGITCHQSGETNKSTYHLRLAAIAGLPTAMLMYALACRHGWGMRPNQEEGVKWLRKAIDMAGLDVADAEEKLNVKAKLDPVERKEMKARYALAIYELGNSSMHGWGCAKDKALAVRCYEIAGSWGDRDGLNDAAECYANGVGVKKDLRKAASLYRKAHKMGVSMAGNSWIWKEKYLSEDTTSPEKEQKRPDTAVSSKESKKDERPPATRQRSRSIWGRPKKEKLPQPTMPATGRLELD